MSGDAGEPPLSYPGIPGFPVFIKLAQSHP
jgi:hypothetical protein